MRFIFTDHMKYQMFNRNISESQVTVTVIRPDRTETDRRDPNLTIAVREFTPGTLLKVWYRLERDAAAVVSCILVSTRRERGTQTDSSPKTSRANIRKIRRGGGR